MSEIYVSDRERCKSIESLLQTCVKNTSNKILGQADSYAEKIATFCLKPIRIEDKAKPGQFLLVG